MTGSGTVIANLAAGVAHDAAGNASRVSTSTDNTVTYNMPPPIVTINLGTAATFGAFGGGAGMTNEGVDTVINGDIGTTAVSTTVTGFHDSTGDGYTETPLNIGDVTGRIYTAPPPPVIFAPGGPYGGTAATKAIADAAALDALAAYNDLAGLATTGPDPSASGELSGLTLAPGVYKSAGGTFNILPGGTLTLDAEGNANAVWVFQMGASLTVGAIGAGETPARVVFKDGVGQATNVYWQVGSAATINTGAEMVGTIIATAGVTFSTAGQVIITTLDGRALGLDASVTMVNTHINVPDPVGVAPLPVSHFRDVPATGFGPAGTDSFWAFEDIEAAYAAHIVTGYDDGTYRPESSVTRDQMAVFISRALAGGDTSVPAFTGTPSFSDVDASNWALKYVQYAMSKGVVKGYSDGTYKPTDQVDRGQMSVFIARAIATPADGADLVNYTPPATATFPDVATTFWAYKYVEYIAQPSIDVTMGYPDGDYHPEYVCTRDQMAVYVTRAFKLPL
jgi:hypothetical protein